MKGVVTRVEQKIQDWLGRKKSIIYIFIRGEDKKRYVFMDPKFEPYCYFKRGFLAVNTFKEIRKHRIVTINGKSYLKVWTDLPYHVSKLRNIIEHKHPFIPCVYEADILFPLRYMIDKQIRGVVEWKGKSRPQPIEENIPSHLRIAILDIELLLNRIKCLTIWDSYDEKYYTFYWNKKQILISDEQDWIIDWSPTEEDMLIKVLRFLVKKDHDVITGYNIDWDINWIRKRVLDLQLGKAWDSWNALGYHMPAPRDKKKKFRDFWVTQKHQNVPGRNVVDLLEILLKMERHQLAEFSLDYVARNYLKPPMRKLQWHGLPIGKNIHKIWPQDPIAVLKYNKHDVLLCVELNKQQSLLSFADELRKFVGCQLDDIFSNKRIAHIELLRKAKYPVPVTKKETRPYKGAIVIPPKKGVYTWIIVMDFRSLYPSIILQLNIDPDTYLTKAQRTKFNITNAYILKDPTSKTEFWFKKQPEGDLPAILRSYLAKRDDKKAEIKKLRRILSKKDLYKIDVLDTQQIALKVIANAFYGSLLYRGVPAGYQCARAVTCGAREAIKFAKKKIESWGYSVIYGDTDSIMIESKFDTYTKVVEEAGYLSKRMEKVMPQFLQTFGGTHGKNYLYLALDKVFKMFLIDEKKKRYAGIPISDRGEGKLEVKGFGIVRSDVSKFSRDLQRTLIKEILRGRQKEDIKYIAEEILKEYDKVPLTDIGVPCVLTKKPSAYKANSIQKKAFTLSNKYLGTNYGVGDKPKRIYVKMTSTPVQVVDVVDVIAFSSDNLKLPKWLEIDWPKMMKHSVKPKVDKVLKFVGLEWKEIKLRSKFKKKKKPRKKKKKKAKKKGKKKSVRKVSKTSTKRKSKSP